MELKSVKQLQKERTEREVANKLEEKYKQAEIDELKKSWDEKLATEYITATLPELIAECERNGIKSFQFPSDSGYNGSGSFFSPKSKHGKKIVSELNRLGYKAKIITKEVRNIEFDFYGDGEYHIVNAPGTHLEYYLVVSWD